MLLFYPVARGNIEDISLKSSTQMLKKPVWENLFKFPENTPLHSFEFYADSAFQRSFTFEPKGSRLRSCETGELNSFYKVLKDLTLFIVLS